MTLPSRTDWRVRRSNCSNSYQRGRGGRWWCSYYSLGYLHRYDLVTVLKITHHHPSLDGFLRVASHNNGDDGNDLSSSASLVYVLCACLPTYLTHHLPWNCTSPRPTGTIYDSCRCCCWMCHPNGNAFSEEIYWLPRGLAYGTWEGWVEIFEDPTDNDATASLRCFVGWKTTEDELKGLNGRDLRTLDGECCQSWRNPSNLQEQLSYDTVNCN